MKIAGNAQTQIRRARLLFPLQPSLYTFYIQSFFFLVLLVLSPICICVGLITTSASRFTFDPNVGHGRVHFHLTPFLFSRLTDILFPL